MVAVKLKGKHQEASTEEIRGMVQAVASILEMGKLSLRSGGNQILVEFVKREALGINHLTGGKNGGLAYPTLGKMKIMQDANTENLFTIIIHEAIHLYLNLTEQATSTLTARLKPDIVAIYGVLVANVYQRAAYLAHCRKGMAYFPKGADKYNDQQWQKEGVEALGKKHRKKKVA